jgi:hypothetical protein
MLDIFGIAFSGLIMLYVVFRAVQLDRSTPWFPALNRAAAKREAAAEQTRPTGPVRRPR